MQKFCIPTYMQIVYIKMQKTELYMKHAEFLLFQLHVQQPSDAIVGHILSNLSKHCK